MDDGATPHERKGIMLNARHLPQRKVQTYLEQDPVKMSSLGVWKGLCTPRTDDFCIRNCGDRPCGYYKEAKRRGLDLDALNRRPPRQIGVEVTEEEITALKNYRKAHGLGMDELCQAFGISRHTYINYTKGRRVTPRIKGKIKKAMEGAVV